MGVGEIKEKYPVRFMCPKAQSLTGYFYFRMRH